MDLKIDKKLFLAFKTYLNGVIFFANLTKQLFKVEINKTFSSL